MGLEVGARVGADVGGSEGVRVGICVGKLVGIGVGKVHSETNDCVMRKVCKWGRVHIARGKA